jgi:hypothetical protein
LAEACGRRDIKILKKEVNKMRVESAERLNGALAEACGRLFAGKK